MASTSSAAAMEFEEYPLLNVPTLMLIVLRAAAAGPVTIETYRADLDRLLARANERPGVSDKDMIAHLAKARDHLVAARLLTRIDADRSVITERGRRALVDHPDGIDDSVLEQFAEFRAYIAASTKRRTAVDQEVSAAKEYDQGYAAFLAGETQRENPYDFDAAEHLLWDCGWFAALDDDIAHQHR
ncbi:MAG TPA: hypothetical protein VJ924_15775, partial [Alphaproteobacteria bacterium]|nr:hypothetical protein [Alphaproteobacteria bacterium]